MKSKLFKAGHFFFKGVSIISICLFRMRTAAAIASIESISQLMLGHSSVFPFVADVIDIYRRYCRLIILCPVPKPWEKKGKIAILGLRWFYMKDPWKVLHKSWQMLAYICSRYTCAGDTQSMTFV